MHPFGYVRAREIDSAIAAASDLGSAFMAGGTGMVDLMQDSALTPQLLVDINPLPLATIEEGPQGVRIGALVRNSNIAENQTIHDRYPVLSEALFATASPQLRGGGYSRR